MDHFCFGPSTNMKADRRRKPENLVLLIKVKVKITLEKATKAKRRSSGIALLFL
jgi:hypothetical protein